MMDDKKDVSFNYNYSAAQNNEVLEIRNKYLPKDESKLDQLLRLDRAVQMAGLIEALCLGLISCLVFGLGLCMTMQVMGESAAMGVVLSLVGMAGMLINYPIYRAIFNKTKSELVPQILELTDQLTGEPGKRN